MKCFIAMAFGREDADKVYDGLICSVLKERGITPVRVDRLEHNENIDDKMMEGLREADFVIADLTYARPSVYFEAGYAERQVPVIYTVRRDHLAPRHGDEFGNFRIHFDLLMRNVIDWTDPGDALFVTRLSRRIDEVLVPLHTKKEEQSQQARARAGFAALSYEDRCKAITTSIARTTSLQEFNLLPPSGWALMSSTVRAKTSSNVLECLIVHFVDLKDKTQDARRGYIDCRVGHERLDLNSNKILRRLDKVKEHYVGCFLDSLPSEEIEQVLSVFRKGAVPGMLISDDTINIPVLPFETNSPVFYPVFGGEGIGQGACVKDPPRSISAGSPGTVFEFYNPGFRVVSCSTRSVPRLQTYQAIHSIRSIEEFEPLLKASIRAALTL